MTQKKTLGALQLAIMRVLWERGEVSVADVREALQAERPLAHTTVATMLTKMERRGLVQRRADGRAYLYSACIAEEQVTTSMMSDLVDRLFAGDVTEMVCRLLDECSVTPQELSRLKALIAKKESEDRHV